MPGQAQEAAATGTAPPQVEVHLAVRKPAEHAAVLAEAISGNRQARLDYYVPTRDETTRRTVDPLEVLTRRGMTTWTPGATSPGPGGCSGWTGCTTWSWPTSRARSMR